ncbi:DUF3592 domain-containing protein [Nonomuraea fuscirosea]|nr:DUF3592 domain-containing protein [Nonomuraea fuscirosea]
MRAESSTGSNPPAYAEGEAVSVAYDPADPRDARISSFCRPISAR